MTKFEILDYGIYANGEHIADFDDKDYAKDFAKACVEQNEVGTVVDVICNYTGEVVYHTERVEKVTVEEVIVEVDPDGKDEEEAEQSASFSILPSARVPYARKEFGKSKPFGSFLCNLHKPIPLCKLPKTLTKTLYNLTIDFWLGLWYNKDTKGKRGKPYVAEGYLFRYGRHDCRPLRST